MSSYCQDVLTRLESVLEELLGEECAPYIPLGQRRKFQHVQKLVEFMLHPELRSESEGE